MSSSKKSRVELPQNLYQVVIELTGGRIAKLITEDADIARREFEYIRSQGRYSGFWIQSIRLEIPVEL